MQIALGIVIGLLLVTMLIILEILLISTNNTLTKHIQQTQQKVKGKATIIPRITEKEIELEKKEQRGETITLEDYV